MTNARSEKVMQEIGAEFIEKAQKNGIDGDLPGRYLPVYGDMPAMVSARPMQLPLLPPALRPPICSSIIQPSTTPQF